MRYDFTSILDRTGMDSMALEADKNGALGTFELKRGFDMIPMWVADMSFPTSPSITKALLKRAAHPAFGYFTPSDAYYESIINWQRLRNHSLNVTRENIDYDNGVLGGIVTSLGVLCQKGDKVLLHAPTYIGFTGVLKNAGYHIVLSDLMLDDDHIWRMNYLDMEEKIIANNIHVCIFCSPHNPTGRVWTRNELEKMMDIFRRHDVYVISDEIWSDLILFDHQHFPTQLVSQDASMRTIALYAPSKTFNLSGLPGSYRIIYNKYLLDRTRRESSLSHYNSMNVLYMHALIAAYSDEGASWLDQLKIVLSQNVDYAYNYILSHFKGISLSKPQGTYMLFLDCENWCRSHYRSIDDILVTAHRYGVLIQDGRPFHGIYGIRINLALPLSRLQEALDRLDRYVFNLKS